MKIIHIVPFIGEEASGPAYCVPALCEALQNNGCEIVLFTLEPLPMLFFNYSVKGFKRRKFPHPTFGRSPEMFRSLLKESINVDLIHNHSLWMAPNIYAGLLSRKKNIPLINTPHGTLTDYSLKRSVWKKNISMLLGQKKALEITECFHATANLEVADIESFSPGKPIANIPNGIDLPKLSKLSKTNRRKLLFLGRLDPKKGIENLLHSWSALEDSFKNWDLDIIGLGDITYTNKLETIIENLQLKRVKIINPVYGNEKNIMYQKADLFVLPSYSENFGMTVAESLANGTPVITTNKTPWLDLGKYECGWCIPIGVETLTATLENALKKTPSELDLMGRRGRAWMQKEFSWDSIAKEMIATYQWILTKKNKPKCIVDE